MSVEASLFERISPSEFYRRFLSKGIRPDGRSLLAQRSVSVHDGNIRTSDNSCSVRIGSTVALAGIKLEVASPSADDATKGKIILNVDFPAVSSSKHPRDRMSDAALVSDLLSTVFKNMFDLSRLLIQEDAAVWIVYVDVCILCDDGAVLEAAALAASCALSSLQLPHVSISDDMQVSADPDASKRRHVFRDQECVLGGVSYALIQSHAGETYVVCDPSSKETGLALGSVLTFLIDQSGKTRLAFKEGGEAWSIPQFSECAQHAAAQAVDTLKEARLFLNASSK
eukprot:ANDGO_02821.mRNA.1 Exosome complex component rrp43